MAFRFKHFRIEDGESTMPVGTDSMLLGAWSDPATAGRILDIGTGCGVLALMMAQKSNAFVDAVEIDPPSALQAERNFRNSPWSDRLKVIPTSVLEYQLPGNARYDFIISNPPYFERSLRSPDPQKNRAHHDEALSLGELLERVGVLLAPHGRFATLLPAKTMAGFIEKAAGLPLYPFRILKVKPNPAKHVSRILVEFSKKRTPAESGELYIQDKTGHFTPEYLQMTREFHYF